MEEGEDGLGDANHRVGTNNSDRGRLVLYVSTHQKTLSELFYTRKPRRRLCLSEQRELRIKGRREAPRETIIEMARMRRRRWEATSSREEGESLVSKRLTLELVKG